jgi:hypothetical protein
MGAERDVVVVWDTAMTLEAEKLAADQDEEDEAFLRRVIFPEEDRRLFTATPWRGGYRWFRSPNVVPIEQWRQRQKTNQPK